MTRQSDRQSDTPFYDALVAHVRSQTPRFVDAVIADAKLTARMRGEAESFGRDLATLRQVLRFMWVTDAFAAQVCYRARARLRALGVPILPTLLHRLSIVVADLYIGDTVLVHPGFYIGHGIVVIDGFVEVHSGVRIMPGVTLGLRDGTRGPTIEPDVTIGTGAKVLGRITVGRGARIGANAVVIDDVEPGVTVVGAPARPTRRD